MRTDSRVQVAPQRTDKKNRGRIVMQILPRFRHLALALPKTNFAMVWRLTGASPSCPFRSKKLRTIRNYTKSFRGWGRGGGDPFSKGSLPHKLSPPHRSNRRPL
ncbi:protein of unknown function [Desulfovibrio sp. 86]|nr:protein of unknown function [Desulfovibrio sp. 86]